MLSIAYTWLSIAMTRTFQTNKPFATPNAWRGLGWILPGLIMLMSIPANADQPVTQADTITPRQLNALSQQLIDKVKTGKAEATEFRINVVYYRESLRSLMLANEKVTSHRFTSGLLMKMVRMSALLQSAAECQTGRYISCPVNLLHQLDQQQKQLKLAVASATSSP